LAKRFDNIEEQWRTYRKHFDHIQGTAAQIDNQYGKLRRDFLQVMRDSQVALDGQAASAGPIPADS
jgi:hypothetical protein